MEWYSNLYMGERAQKKKGLIQKVESGKTPVNTYLITLSFGKKNQLEIIPVWNLKFWYQKKQCPRIVGLACGKDEAVELVVQIAEDVLKKTGDLEIRRYFEAET